MIRAPLLRHIARAHVASSMAPSPLGPLVAIPQQILIKTKLQTRLTVTVPDVSAVDLNLTIRKLTTTDGCPEQFREVHMLEAVHVF